MLPGKCSFTLIIITLINHQKAQATRALISWTQKLRPSTCHLCRCCCACLIQQSTSSSFSSSSFLARLHVFSLFSEETVY